MAWRTERNRMAGRMNDDRRERCIEIFARVTYERVRQTSSSPVLGEPWEALTSQHKELWLGVTQHMGEYVDALIDAGMLVCEPVAYAVFSSHTFFVPPKIRDVHLRLTRQEADDALEMLQCRADANPQWACGARYLIGGLHPVPHTDRE